MIRMKLKIYIIVFGKAINGTKTFMRLRNMKDIIKMERSTRGT